MLFPTEVLFMWRNFYNEFLATSGEVEHLAKRTIVYTVFYEIFLLYLGALWLSNDVLNFFFLNGLDARE